MATYGTTPDGRVIDEAMVDRMAAEAEAGFPCVRFTRPKAVGRPRLAAAGPARSRTLRLPPSLDAALEARAASDETTPSKVMREALIAYLAPAP